MNFGIVSLFPGMFDALNCGITGKALANQLFRLSFYNPRNFTCNKHRTVDDRPYGGGPGMVLQAEPLIASLEAAQVDYPNAAVVYLSPQGETLSQKKIEKVSQQTSLILLCGRYEGIDERVIQLKVDELWSVGDYVLSGGELAAMVIIDAVVRLLPNVLGNQLSAEEDSFSSGLLDCPHYTRPKKVAGLSVPPVLLSGNHAEILSWRRKQALERTLLKRSDLLGSENFTHRSQWRG